VIYEYALRLLGAGIAGMIHFLPLAHCYTPLDNTLTISTTLTSPVTEETRTLVRNGWTFPVAYECYLIVNDAHSYHADFTRRLSFAQGRWNVDGAVVPPDSIMAKMGMVVARFPGLRFDERDKIVVFVKAHIAQDSAFASSTGMRPDVLWNCYEPRKRETFVFFQGRFEEKNDRP
jgi:hypothetical protein